MTEDKWIVIDQAPNHFHAEIIRGLLEAQDVPVMLFEEAVGRVMPFTIGSTAWVEVMVPKEDEQRAKQIVIAYYENTSTDDEKLPGDTEAPQDES